MGHTCRYLTLHLDDPTPPCCPNDVCVCAITNRHYFQDRPAGCIALAGLVSVDFVDLWGIRHTCRYLTLHLDVSDLSDVFSIGPLSSCSMAGQVSVVVADL